MTKGRGTKTGVFEVGLRIPVVVDDVARMPDPKKVHFIMISPSNVVVD